jgi:poly-D-alanine transfer protein DltD
VGQGGFEVNEFPILGGITYYADDAISSTTAGWLFSKEAIKIFRGPTRQYTVANPDTESEKYVTKSYMTPETVDSGLIYIVTGITG